IPERVHVVGIGGAGMSALAKILAGRGHRVSGSDLRAGTTMDLLSALGIEVWEGSRPDRVGEAELVVASSAVPDHDPELEAARRAGAPGRRRPAPLEALNPRRPLRSPTAR